MASEKKRRKQRAVDRKLAHPAAAKLPRDGDRRRRGVDLARLELQRKQAEREWTIDSMPEGFPSSGEDRRS